MSLFLLLISVHHLLSRLVFGTMFSPEIPRAAMLLVNWIFGALMFALALQLLLDVLAALTALVRRRAVAIPAAARYAVIGVALGLAAWAVGQAIRVPPVRQVEIPIKGLAREFDGFHVVQLTDLHLSRLFQEPWAAEVVRRTNALAPDLIVITGDLIDGTPEARRQDVAPLGGLRAADGAYVSPGNHEYYFGYERWMARYAELGLRPLANGHVVLRRGDARLVLAGVTDPAAAGVGLAGPDLAHALAGVPADAPVILLDHRPADAMTAARAGVALQLSGHTHGGLLRGFDRFIARFNNGYVSGLYDVAGMPLYVSNGTGLWIGFALRFGKPPEITSFRLRVA